MADNWNCLFVITPINHDRFRQIKSRNTSQGKEVINKGFRKFTIGLFLAKCFNAV
jgi:hypothetical protein